MNFVELWIFSSGIYALHHCRAGGTPTADLIQQLATEDT